eukprot:1537634-Pyramimonas_sp.AAC.1
MEEDLPVISVSDVRRAVRQMKAKAGREVDMMIPTDFERLPGSVLAELATLFEAWEHYGSWSGQISLICGRMVWEKVSGDRIIGSVAVLGRVWSMIREHLARTWSTSTEQEWEAAI